jgi:RHS repeat-associated protein
MNRRHWLLLASLLTCLVVPSSLPAQTGFRYVHPTDPTCGGHSPCYTTIQAAVNAATAGEHIVLQVGIYQQQVNITGKNNAANATEADRIVIEADPAAAPGSVVVQGAVTQCTNGYAIRLQQSKFITIRALTITGAGGQAISLMGGNNQNHAIHLERLRVFGNGSGSCDGGITIARGNPGTLLLNSLIYNNGRNGVATIDADGGPHYLISNTIHANQWSGVSVTHTHEIFLVNNAITGNGTASGSTGGRFGVSRQSSTSRQPAGIHLLNNLICGNRLGEFNGPALDATDSGNLTPTGSEGLGVSASPGCDATATVYADGAGLDGGLGTADDDFRLATSSPALDHGRDPRTLGLAAAFNPQLEADFTGVAGARPRNATGAASALFDIGAFEANPADDTAPVVTISAPPANAHVRGAVPVEAQATDGGSGVASLTLRIDTQPLTVSLTPTLPPPGGSVTATATWNTTAFPEGPHTLTAEAEDAAGNPASATRVLVADNTPPETSITDGASGEIAVANATFAFAGTDNLTLPGSLQFAWRFDGSAWSAFSAATTASFTGLSETLHTFDVKARDLAGNEDPTPASRTFTVRLGPTITGVDPISGPIGTFVTITGTNFEPGTTTVNFNGTAAVLRTVTPTQITTTVPPAATTGTLIVGTSHGAPAVAAFTVTLTGKFDLSATPATVRAIAGDQAAVRIAATGSGAFTNLITLSVNAPPRDIVPVFDSTFLAPGGSTTLTFRVPTSVLPGQHSLAIIGAATIDGQTVTHTAYVLLEVLPEATTAVTGRIMTAETIPQPIPGVSVALGSAFVLTEAAGNFILLAPPAGPNMLFVDGRTASTPSAQFPIVEVQIDVAASGVTRVPFTIYLPILDTANAIDLPLDASGFTTHEVKATTPAIPGLVVTVPLGTRIIGPDGNPVAQLVITPVPVDRSPMPFPPGVSPRVLFAINPGGSVPSQPLPITFPNTGAATPGASADLHYFDLAIGTWSIWGQGTVTADGTQIASVPGAGLPRLAWHFAFTVSLSDQVRSRHAKGGDPVDLVTGRFTATKTDLVLPGRIPVTIQRSYRSENSTPGLFGIGWNLAFYDSVLALVGNGPSLNLILGDQSAYLFQKTNPTVDEWRNSGEPFLAGAVVTPLPGNFNFQIRYKDGTIHRFQRLPGFVAAGLSEIADPNGNVLTITRSTTALDRRILSITEPAGRQLAFAYDGAGRITEIVDPIGRVARYAYDAPGRLETVTDPAGGVTRYTYDAEHRIHTITDARGIAYLTNEYAPDSKRVFRQTQADGGVWNFSFIAPAPPASGGGCSGSCAVPAPSATIVNPRGHSTVYEFDQLGRGFTQAITDALGQTTYFDTFGTPGVVVRDSLGRTTKPEYGANLTLVRLTDAAGHVRTYTYEPTFNRVTSTQDPLDHLTTFQYDTRGNLTAIVDPLGKQTSITYDALGQLTSLGDPLGNTTTFGYDGFGNLTSITDPLGNTTTRQYDLVGRLIRQTDPHGKATRFTYDALNRLTTIGDTLAGVTRLTYDANGNLLAVTDARGGTTTYTYDVMDRVAFRIDPLGAIETFDYDLMGNLISHLDRKGQVATFTYDALDRRIAAIHADSSTTFQYDAVGRLAIVRDSAGGSFSYAYDALDRVSAEDGPLGRTSYFYDAAGRRTQMNAPGAATVAYGYDAASRLTSVSRSPLAPATLQYDDAGRRTRLTLPNQVSTEYQYNPASQLTALLYRNAAGPLGDLTYQYDAAGHRVGVGGSFARTLLPDAVPTAAYDVANRQLAFGVATMAYDANGSLLTLNDTDGVTQFGWDARGRLATLATPSTSSAFTYDAFGRRVQRRLGAEAIAYLYDGVDVVDELTGASATSYLRTPEIDESLSRGGSEFYVSDALGSTMALTNLDGTVQTRYSYAPFGDTSIDGASANRFHFTGREADGTGLYYYRARYYHPQLHRFVAEDPVGLGGRDTNLYAYTFGSPINFIDPFGLDVIVRQYCCHAPNTFGHVGLAIDSSPSRGFYPEQEDWRVPLNVPVPGELTPDSRKWRSDQVVDTVRIPTTLDQDRRVQRYFDALQRNPGLYRLYGRNCSSAVQEALRAGGIDLGPPTILPGTVINRARGYIETIAPQ